CLFPIFYVVKKDSPNALLSIFFYYTLYFYFYSFNITRQMIAVSFILIAFYMLKKEKKLFSFITILFASLFHISALIALPTLLISRRNTNNGFYIWMVIFSFIAGLFLLDYLIALAQYLPYTYYFTRFSVGNIMGNMFYLIILNSFFFFILFSIKERSMYFKIFFYFIIVANLFVRFPFY